MNDIVFQKSQYRQPILILGFNWKLSIGDIFYKLHEMFNRYKKEGRTEID